MKCDLCKNEIGKSFLGKIKGSYIRIDGDKRIVCCDCQSKYKDEIKEEF